MKLAPATTLDLELVERALQQLRSARDCLVGAGALKSAAKVRTALKSAEGAACHVYRRFDAVPALTQDQANAGCVACGRALLPVRFRFNTSRLPVCQECYADHNDSGEGLGAFARCSGWLEGAS